MHENEVISEITETTIDRIITILQDRHVILDDNLLLSGIVRNDYELITSGYTSGLCDTSAFTLDFEETGIDSNKLYFELPKDHINPMFKNVELNTIYASPVKITGTNPFIGLYSTDMQKILDPIILNSTNLVYRFFMDNIYKKIINNQINEDTIITEIKINMSAFFSSAVNSPHQNFFNIYGTDINYVRFLTQLNYILKNQSDIKDKNCTLGLIYRKHDVASLRDLMTDAIQNNVWIPDEQITMQQYLEHILQNAGLEMYIGEILGKLDESGRTAMEGYLPYWNTEEENELTNMMDMFLGEAKNEYDRIAQELQGDAAGLMALQMAYQEFTGQFQQAEEQYFGEKLSTNNNQLNSIIGPAIQSITRYIWRYIPDEEDPNILYNESFYKLNEDTIYCELQDDGIDFPVTTATANDISLQVSWDF